MPFKQSVFFSNCEIIYTNIRVCQSNAIGKIRVSKLNLQGGEMDWSDPSVAQMS